VLAFGDSVTFGTGAGSSEDYPALLATATGWNIINAGIPGDTAQKGQSRIESLLKQHNPQLVIIGLGGNDFLRRRPEQAVKEDLRNIVVQVQNSGAIAALIAAPEGRFRRTVRLPHLWRACRGRGCSTDRRCLFQSTVR